MERLIEIRGKIPKFFTPKKAKQLAFGNPGDQVAFEEVFKKLYEYEDTGLTPEEIKDHEEIFKAYRHVCGGKPPQEIKKALELLDAEEQGLLIKLPCKVGDIIYTTNWYNTEKFPCKVEGFIVINKEIWITADNDTRHINYQKNIGTHLFLTKEEAEQALKGSAPS